MKSIEPILEHTQSAGLCSLLVQQDGLPLIEHYFNGWTTDSLTPIGTIYNSLLSLLTGMAVDEGFLHGLDQRISDFFLEYLDGESNPIFDQITLEHLLTFRSGLQWPSGSQNQQALLQRITRSRDWTKTLLALKVQHRPGDFFELKDADLLFLSNVLTLSTGQSAYRYARMKLFSALEIVSPEWGRDPQGNTHNYLLQEKTPTLTTPAVASLGQLYLDRGRWQGQSILPADWITQSTRVHVAENGYGYHWWVEADGTYSTGSQGPAVLAVDPSHRLVTAACARPGSAASKNLGALVRQIRKTILQE